MPPLYPIRPEMQGLFFTNFSRNLFRRQYLGSTPRPPLWGFLLLFPGFSDPSLTPANEALGVCPKVGRGCAGVDELQRLLRGHLPTLDFFSHSHTSTLPSAKVPLRLRLRRYQRDAPSSQ